MRWLYCSIVVVFLPIGNAQAVETMRIAISSGHTSVKISARNLLVGFDDKGGRLSPSGTSAMVGLRKGHLTLNGKSIPHTALRFRAHKSRTLSVLNTKVHGDIVVQKAHHTLVVVNVLPLEEYLVGVLGGEMLRSFPMEALKAQAVAARTYAVHKKLKRNAHPYHLGNSVISQVYKGLSARDLRMRKAVNATRGLILTWRLRPIEAYYHSSCGGRTESGVDALARNLPYLKPVRCPCKRLPTSHWSLTLPFQVLKRKFKQFPMLQVQRRTPTGRVAKIRVGRRSISGVAFRKRIGYMKLKSLAFRLRKAPKGWHINGLGFGHGAGMCQWGASVYAKRGWSFQKILRHYYANAELQLLY